MPDAATPPAPVPAGLPLVSPDLVEQERGDQIIDDLVPTRGYGTTPMVGLGGSAGSIPALRAFFEAMPAQSGMVFVVVLHLSPGRESTMAELLARSTAMPVRQAEDGMRAEANHVYVIPPGKHLASVDGHLRLSDLQPERGTRVAVDLFFRSLADTHGPLGTAIVLSGADGDGAIGVKRIKERGGLTVAQDPDECEHPSMPRTAINTGMVDWVLAVADMPARLLEYQARGRRLRLPPEEGPAPAAPAPLPARPGDDETALREVLVFLRMRTGRDFSAYKRATLVRRVSRRMQVNGVEDLPAYLSFLRTHAGEAGALLQDLLISVTNFFRDREVWEALGERLPELFRDKAAGDTVRVWVPACATGEEAYSLAMMLLEHLRRLEAPPTLQVFACDLDDEAIRVARAGSYPDAIVADVSEARLQRFFIKETHGYRIRREVREVVLFATHDLLRDAPFSRMDLISCRNLLIYLGKEAQDRVFDLFHFSLIPGGLLQLGTSEAVEEGSPLFSVLHKKHRLFRQRPVSRTGLPVPVPRAAGTSTLQRALEAQERAAGGPTLPGTAFAPTVAAPFGGGALPGTAARDRVSLGELHFRLVERFAPPSVVVNAAHEIVHLSENAGRFLHFAGGEPTTNLPRVVLPALRTDLRAALLRATEAAGRTVETPGVPVDLDGVPHRVLLRVTAAQDLGPGCLLVEFDAREAAAGAGADGGAAAPADPSAATREDAGTERAAIRHLEMELAEARAQLRDNVDQSEASREELQASNEELQAMNEELRSTTEELETGREELQSINEELSTVNGELKAKLDELGRTNSDLHNLMTATAIASVFVDREFRITRYTPPAVSLFRLIASDPGRPLSDLRHQLDYPQLREDAGRVMETLVPIEREVIAADGRWFLARLLPYRTVEDQIAGVVLTFVDISPNKSAEHRRDEMAGVLDRQSRLFDLTLSSIADFAYAFDRAGRFIFANRPLLELLDRPLAEVVGRDFHDLGYPSELATRLQAQIEQVFTTRKPVTDETPFTGPAGEAGFYEYIFQPVVAADGSVEAVAGTTRDITERRRAAEALTASREQLRLIVENARDYAIFTMDLERRVMSWNAGAEAILGYVGTEILGQRADLIFTPEDRAAGAPEEEAQTALTAGRAVDERWHLRQDGSRFWGSGVMMAMRDPAGRNIGLLKIFRDQTEQLETQEALERNRQELMVALRETEAARAAAEAADRAKNQFLAVLSHELRTPLTPVLMAAQTLARRPDLPPTVGEALAMITRNVQLEAHFIDDLLDLTRIGRGSFELVRAPMDLHEAVRRAVEICEPDLAAKRQRLTVNLEAPEHRLAAGDPARLQQVMWNLLKNAAKFTPENGEIRVRSRADGPGRVAVEFADTGIGLAPDTLERIFDPFEQADPSIARQFGGLGLGLAISKATVDAHGGTLRAASPGPGQGTTFTVSLPLAG